ncbi:MAG: HD domain-containing phosphohydrolase [Thermodesulfobacteriota bacterium]
MKIPATEHNHTLLFLSRDEARLAVLYEQFREEGYKVLIGRSAEEGIAFMKKTRVALVIADFGLPDRNGVEFVIAVSEHAPETKRIVLARELPARYINTLCCGTIHKFIKIPWKRVELSNAVSKLLAKEVAGSGDRYKALQGLIGKLRRRVKEEERQVREAFSASVSICMELIELFAPRLAYHSKEVTGYTRDVVIRMGLERREVMAIESAALLHDIGLIGAPRRLLDKDEDGMNENDLFLFRQHPVMGQEVVNKSQELRQTGLLIRSHHEGWSGRGYPDGLQHDEIPVGARIIRAADLYVHKFQESGSEAAIECVKGERGVDLDPDVVNHLVQVVEGVPVDPSIHQVPVSRIEEGMILATDVVTKMGTFLLPKGTILTQSTIQRLLEFNEGDPIVEWIRVDDSKKA